MNITDEDRRKGAELLRERRDGWPVVDKTPFGERLRGRRFDEPGMEVKFKSRDYGKTTNK